MFILGEGGIFRKKLMNQKKFEKSPKIGKYSNLIAYWKMLNIGFIKKYIS